MTGSPTIGIVGGGQLGRMLTLAALPLGFKVIVVDPTPDSPAAQVGAKQITAGLYDRQALKQLAENADYLTVEIEHLDTKLLDDIAKLGKPVNPSPATVRVIQDKLAQKELLHQAGIPVVPFFGISSQASAEQAMRIFGGKIMIKARYGAYDGRGNMAASNNSDIARALELFKSRKLYAEQFVPFTKELAVMVARGTDEKIATYPVVETIHQRNICVEVLAPAQVGDKLRRQAEQIALRVAKLLNGTGVFGIEMFVTEVGDIVVNEIAPRVHNSGHYTIEACDTSQFEQHIRAITGLPLGSTSLKVPAAAMVNILGERDGPTKLQGLGKALANPHTAVHIYGKSPTKPDRKMGHITATGKTVQAARQRASNARRHISI